MRKPSKGLGDFPHILTEADVLVHCYGALPGAADQADEPAPASSPPGASSPPFQREEIPPPPDSELSDADLAVKLETENNKPSLVAMAEAAGVDQSGTKHELAERLVAHYRSR